MRRHAWRDRAGFTLMELMLALTIFAGATVALVDVNRQAHTGMAEGENSLIAAHLAQWRMEELRNVAYASVASEARAAVSTPAGYTRFDREVTVTTPYTNLKQVIVTVYYDAPGTGGEANVSLQSYRSAL